MVWGDQFIITPSEFYSAKVTLYCASVICSELRTQESFSPIKEFLICLSEN